MRTIFSAILTSALLFALNTALGAAPPDRLDADGLRLLENGLAAAKAGDFDTAIARFEQARQRAPAAPEPLFNLALANDHKGDREPIAEAWYRAYLAAAPSAPNAAAVEDRTRRLEEAYRTRVTDAIARAERAVAAAPASPVDKERESWWPANLNPRVHEALFETYAEAGMREKVLAGSLPPISNSFRRATEAARVFMEAGDIATALALADLLASPRLRIPGSDAAAVQAGMIRSSVVSELVGFGEVTSAYRVARDLPAGADRHSTVQVTLATAARRIGNRERALEHIEQAVRLALLVDGAYKRSTDLLIAAATSAQLGFQALAEDILANPAIELQSGDTAYRAAYLLYLRARAIRHLPAGEAMNRAMQDAETSAGGIEDLAARAHLLRQLGFEWAGGGQPREALRLAGEIEAISKHGAFSLRNRACGEMARQGEIDAAWTTAASLATPMYRAYAYEMVAIGLGDSRLGALHGWSGTAMALERAWAEIPNEIATGLSEDATVDEMVRGSLRHARNLAFAQQTFQAKARRMHKEMDLHIATAADGTRHATSFVYIHASPHQTAPRIGLLARGSEIAVTGKVKLGGRSWYRVVVGERRLLSFGTSGRVADVSVEPGDAVATGEMLLQLEGAQEAAQVRIAVERLASIQAEIAHARQEFERVQRLHALGSASAQAVNIARETMQKLEAQLTDASSAAHDLMQQQVHSPVDGLVTARMVEPGEVVKAGQPALEVLERRVGFVPDSVLSVSPVVPPGAVTGSDE